MLIYQQRANNTDHTHKQVQTIPVNRLHKITIYFENVSSGGLAVKHPAPGANGHRFEPCKRSINFLAHNIVGG